MATEFRVSKQSQRKEFDIINRFDKNKCVLFFTINSRKRYEQVRFIGASSYLMSYEYLRKSLKYYQEEMLPEIQEWNGVFMTDSGAFSFLTSVPENDSHKPEFWKRYIEEYVQFLYDNHQYIYCAANMDLDRIVGREAVNKWNEEYFRPLEKYMQIVYVAHHDKEWYNDPFSYNRIKEYAMWGAEYIGIPSGLNIKTIYPKLYQLAKQLGIRYHGFGFTVYDYLLNKPFFSVDSTTWIMGSRFGETHIDTGRDYIAYNRNFHHLRKGLKTKVDRMGLDYETIDTRRAKDGDVNRMNLHAWLRFAKNFYRAGNLKLHNKPIKHYDVFYPGEPDYPEFYLPLKDREKVILGD